MKEKPPQFAQFVYRERGLSKKTLKIIIDFCSFTQLNHSHSASISREKCKSAKESSNKWTHNMHSVHKMVTGIVASSNSKHHKMAHKLTNIMRKYIHRD